MLMESNEYKKYLKEIKINRLCIIFTQILILLLIIFIWDYLSSKGIINSFI